MAPKYTNLRKSKSERSNEGKMTKSQLARSPCDSDVVLSSKRKCSYKIKGTKIINRNHEKVVTKVTCKEPLLFQYEPEFDLPRNVVPERKNEPDSDSSERSGILRYALSDRSFIEKGWTVLPIEKIMRKKNIYRMHPAQPEFDWFEFHKKKGSLKYATGEKLAEIFENGRGRWYYKNGRLALDYYDCEEAYVQQRFVIYSSGDADKRGRSHPVTVLAMFDFIGNGVVFDHTGKIRLKYNQDEGVILDRKIGPISRWKWHSLNDPPVLLRVMTDTYMNDLKIKKLQVQEAKNHKATPQPPPDSEDMLAIECNNFIKEKAKKLSQKFQPYQIKMKALTINDQFSLKILDQTRVHLLFKDGGTNLKLNLGMIIDSQEILGTENEVVGEIYNNLDESFGGFKTDSIYNLQCTLNNARHFDRARKIRESKIRPTVPEASADRFKGFVSKPLYPLRPVHSLSSSNVTNNNHCRKKPPRTNLHFETRLI